MVVVLDGGTSVVVVVASVVVVVAGGQSTVNTPPDENTMSGPNRTDTTSTSPNTIGSPAMVTASAVRSTSRTHAVVADSSSRSLSGCTDVLLSDRHAVVQVRPCRSSGTGTAASCLMVPGWPRTMVSMGMAMSHGDVAAMSAARMIVVVAMRIIGPP